MPPIDLASQTPEELEALMDAQEFPPEDPAPEPEPDGEPPIEGEPATEAAPEAEATPEEELTPEQTERELLLAKIELAEEERRKAETIAGRHGGELGFLRNKVRELEAAILGRKPAPEPDAGMGEFAEQPAPETPSYQPPVRDKITAYVVARAVPEAVNDFERRFPDSLEMAQPIVEYLKATGFDMNAVKTWDDPVAAASEMDRALSEAYYHVRSEAKAARVAELTTRRADQYAKLDQAKKRATMSGGGGASPPPTRQKSIEDMTPDELDAEMRRLNPVY